jgi:hypothetical protein
MGSRNGDWGFVFGRDQAPADMHIEAAREVAWQGLADTYQWPCDNKAFQVRGNVEQK